jgi:Endosomal/lysosomal potassium channel TMEM175
LEDALKRPTPRISRPRIESLSDIIFGLALAISTVPLISRLPSRPFGILIDVAEFGFSFLILISVWLGYTNIMSVLPIEDAAALNLNLVLLFLVSVEPYLFYLNITFDLSTHELFLNYSSILYALDMAGLMLILALFTQRLTKEERGLLPDESLNRFRRVRDVLYLSATLFAITVLPPFWTLKLFNQPIRFYFWFIPLIVSSVIRVSERQFQNKLRPY